MKKKKLILGLAACLMLIVMMGMAALAAVPGQVRITKVTTGENQVTLQWGKISAATGYNIYLEKSGEDTLIQKVSSSKRKAKITGLKNSQTYVFKIAAVNADGEGRKSVSATVTPKVSSPGSMVSFRVSGNGNAKTSLKWSKLKKATGYILYQKQEDGSYQQIADTKKTSVTIKGLTNNTVYQFAARAYRTVGGVTTYGPLSKTISARPSDGSGAVSQVHSYYYTKVVVKSTVTAKAVNRSNPNITLTRGTKVVVVSKTKKTSVVRVNSKRYKVSTSVLDFDSSGLIYSNKKAYSTSLAEEYVNYKGYKSSSKYLIWVSTYGQTLYLFKGSQYNWKCILKTTCSTGMSGKHPDENNPGQYRKTETILGVHSVRSKQPTWIFAPDQYAYYATVIKGSGGAIHSELYKPANPPTTLYPGVNRLGYAVSHGCVRVKIDKSKYIYDTVPIGSTCVIY